MLSLTDPVTDVPGVGAKIADKLKHLKIETVSDLLHHYPIRFLDFTRPVNIINLKEKVTSCFEATLSEPKQFRTKSGKLMTQTTAFDGTGQISLSWFNMPFISRLIKPSEKYLIAGKPSFFAGRLTIISPQLESLETNHLHTRGLVPIYPQTEGITSKFLRKLINTTIASITIPETLPPQILSTHNLLPLNESYKHIHFPESKESQLLADRRLSFDEHLRISINNQIEMNRLGLSPKLKINPRLHNQILKLLPFKLTPDQEKVISLVYNHLRDQTPQRMLIQGDTGSGKTVIALFAAAQTLENNTSFCLLAPTQILATQHFETFKKYYPHPDNIVLITGKNHLDHLPDKATIFIGTHALLSQLPQETTPPISTVFIDEQHKFGVNQREQLAARRPQPHVFNMTATPIPRTLALGIFGEIKIATIKHKPKSRLPVKTWVINNQHFKKSTGWLTEHLKNNSKIFVVCPFIHNAASELANVKSAILTYQEYLKLFGSITSVSLIHGQLKGSEKDKILSDFNQAKSGILISTPIIEVGIDIPEANVIIIHSAERFGLAQLHQLRGRVGRGESQGYCFLVPTSDEQLDIDRLQLLTKYHSGLTLAKIDLKLRGSGEIAGTRQHGQLPVRLKYFWNTTLYQKAKVSARLLLEQNPEQAQMIASRLLS